jgi:hypothetical protein
MSSARDGNSWGHRAERAYWSWPMTQLTSEGPQLT